MRVECRTPPRTEGTSHLFTQPKPQSHSHSYKATHTTKMSGHNSHTIAVNSSNKKKDSLDPPPGLLVVVQSISKSFHQLPYWPAISSTVSYPIAWWLLASPKPLLTQGLSCAPDVSEWLTSSPSSLVYDLQAPCLRFDTYRLSAVPAGCFLSPQ